MPALLSYIPVRASSVTVVVRSSISNFGAKRSEFEVIRIGQILHRGLGPHS